MAKKLTANDLIVHLNDMRDMINKMSIEEKLKFTELSVPRDKQPVHERDIMYAVRNLCFFKVEREQKRNRSSAVSG